MSYPKLYVDASRPLGSRHELRALPLPRGAAAFLLGSGAMAIRRYPLARTARRDAHQLPSVAIPHSGVGCRRPGTRRGGAGGDRSGRRWRGAGSGARRKSRWHRARGGIPRGNRRGNRSQKQSHFDHRTDLAQPACRSVPPRRYSAPIRASGPGSRWTRKAPRNPAPLRPSGSTPTPAFCAPSAPGATRPSGSPTGRRRKPPSPPRDTCR